VVVETRDPGWDLAKHCEDNILHNESMGNVKIRFNDSPIGKPRLK
jgi:hypothetical protein